MADVIEQAPLLVKLTETVGKLPGGLVYLLPREAALALILRRVAVPVADLESFPDLVIDEDELQDAGIDWAVIQSA